MPTIYLSLSYHSYTKEVEREVLKWSGSKKDLKLFVGCKSLSDRLSASSSASHLGLLKFEVWFCGWLEMGEDIMSLLIPIVSGFLVGSLLLKVSLLLMSVIPEKSDWSWWRAWERRGVVVAFNSFETISSLIIIIISPHSTPCHAMPRHDQDQRLFGPLLWGNFYRHTWNTRDSSIYIFHHLNSESQERRARCQGSS